MESFNRPSRKTKDSKTPCATDLAQPIVADREFIAQISSAIWKNMEKNLVSILLCL